VNVRRIAAIFLQVVGAATLVLVAFIIIQSLSAEYRYNGSGGKGTPYERDALKFVLDQASVDRKQEWTVIDSSSGARSFTGDHVDYACIQLVHAPNLTGDTGWAVQAEQDEVMKDIVSLASSFARSEGATCFPDEQQANSAKFPRIVRRAVLSGRSPTSAEVILFEPAQMRLYYAGYKT
jgi:hypothetical protein